MLGASMLPEFDVGMRFVGSHLRQGASVRQRRKRRASSEIDTDPEDLAPLADSLQYDLCRFDIVRSVLEGEAEGWKRSPIGERPSHDSMSVWMNMIGNLLRRSCVDQDAARRFRAVIQTDQVPIA